MTASLYQSGSVVCASTAGWSRSASSGMGSPVYKEEVRGKRVRVELDVVAVPSPREAPAPEQVLHLEILAAEAEIQPARLHEAAVQIDHAEDEVVALALRVRDELIVVYAVKAQRPVRLQRPIFPADPVQAPDQRAQRLGTVGIPALDLILFREQVLLAAGLTWLVLHQLVRRPVDSIVGAQSRGEHHASHESRRSAVLQRGVQDVGRVGPHVGPEIL